MCISLNYLIDDCEEIIINKETKRKWPPMYTILKQLSLNRSSDWYLNLWAQLCSPRCGCPQLRQAMASASL